jgi:hypothetical protein
MVKDEAHVAPFFAFNEVTIFDGKQERCATDFHSTIRYEW